MTVGDLIKTLECLRQDAYIEVKIGNTEAEFELREYHSKQIYIEPRSSVAEIADDNGYTPKGDN